ncbi:uncharacterized protein YecT (DUF1311 family) [Pseudomonas nitritireducens]|uniref:Uncharacterized protein YecT (DUF1311 family) n=1 Tax=Pseudomonas nitroreducens TaxID=46680 RepID=A0A7W7KQR4_PSENT|nr:lysozyme inhibitor LprI family protein [Pseudomonas nitritireducens]MBB4866941.1 uncharacterized protein YecT (DUF1311 family) [Pseudomonas nitritireducens]
MLRDPLQTILSALIIFLPIISFSAYADTSEKVWMAGVGTVSGRILRFSQNESGPCIELRTMKPGGKGIAEASRLFCEMDGKSFRDGFAAVELLTSDSRNGRLFLTLELTPLGQAPAWEVECEFGASSQEVTGPSCVEIASVPPACVGVHDSLQLMACFKARREDADNHLNQSYRKMLQRIEQAYSSSPDKALSLKSQLKSAQLQWIRFRDADCELAAFEAEAGSQAHDGNINQCITAATRLRSRQIRDLTSQLAPTDMVR